VRAVVVTRFGGPEVLQLRDEPDPRPAPERPASLRHGSLSLTRPQLHDDTVTREELLERAGDVLRRVADGSLRVRVGATYALADAARAQDDLRERRTTGTLLLQP
jgi:NADPH2:quinone reductase